jgi:hypothetical protein
MTLLLNLELHLRITGIFLLFLAVLNLFIPKRFGWPTEIQRLSLFTRQVFVSHCFFIILLLTFMGLLTFLYAPNLLTHNPLSTALLFALALFWTLRLAAQFFFYSPKLWRGHPFNTTMHILFSCLWIYFATIFTTAWITTLH